MKKIQESIRRQLEGRYGMLVNSLFLLVGAYFIFVTGEKMISRTSVTWLAAPYWINVLLVFSAALLLYGLTGGFAAALLGTDVIFLILSLVNAFLLQVRGRGLDVIDGYSLSAAAEVAGNYRFHIKPVMMIGIVLNLLLMGLLCSLHGSFAAVNRQEKDTENKTGKGSGKGAVYRLMCSLLALGFLCSVPFGSFWKMRGYAPLYFSGENGVLFNLLLQMPGLFQTQPDGYSEETAALLLSAQDAALPETAIGDYPNIIVIMNESLTDYGTLNTREDVLPFLHSLQENTVKGYSYSSVYGGNTAISEYEFLTGNSNILYNTMPYTTLIRAGEQIQALPAQLKALGYHTAAMHPYAEGAYRRNIVYPCLGFDSLYFQEDFEDLSPVRNGLYASDRADYKKLVSLLDEKPEGERLFLFNVTMQNHTPYQGIDKTVALQDTDAYDEAEQYLTMAHESDQAFAVLLEKLQDFPEPVLVLMFGDHQPSFEADFSRYLYGKSRETMSEEERMQQFRVPFYLWANYDIEEAEGIRTSMNYLALPLLETAGIPLTPYQSYLQTLQKEYPVISCGGIIDSRGTYHRQREKDTLLPTYLQVMYARLQEDRDNSGK